MYCVDCSHVWSNHKARSYLQKSNTNYFTVISIFKFNNLHYTSICSCFHGRCYIYSYCSINHKNFNIHRLCKCSSSIMCCASFLLFCFNLINSAVVNCLSAYWFFYDPRSKCHYLFVSHAVALNLINRMLLSPFFPFVLYKIQWLH